MGTLKKVVGLGLAGLLIACLAIGGTFAYLADSETSSDNQVTAGTLDLVPTVSATNYYSLVTGGNAVNGYADFTNLRPGQSGSETWTLVNNGNLSGTLTIACTSTFAENGSNVIESAVPGNNHGGNGDLDLYVGVRVLRRGVYILGSSSNYVPLSNLAACLNAESRTLTAGSSLTYVLQWSVPKPLVGAGPDGLFGTSDDVPVNPNIIQSDTAQVDITFTLTQ